MSSQAQYPRYDELPLDARGWRSGWGVFGAHDQVGRINLITPEARRAAAALVRAGRSFSLDAPIGVFDPPLNPRRRAASHRVIAQATIGYDDAWDEVYPQSGSQWDSLAHVGIDRQRYYNGATADEIEHGTRNGIGHWNQHGIAGRGVVLDLAALAARRDPSYSPGTRVTFDVDDLEEARSCAGLQFEPGDIILLHTGFAKWYTQLEQAQREQLPGTVVSAGLQPSEQVCRYLWDNEISAVASDNFAVEAWPADFSEAAQPFGFLHQMLIGSLGMALGELWWLDELVADCRADGSYAGFLVSSPWNAPTGIGSPANAMFLK